MPTSKSSKQLTKETEAQPLFLIIDGHSLAFRSYYAFATSRRGALQTSTGIPTSICFGFLNSLLQVLGTQKPQFLAVAFDREEPTFRHQADANYKADRKETPEDFYPDLENLQQLLYALNLQIITAPGYEADDILATLAKKASEEGYQVKIVSGDRDLFQLVNREKNITVLYLDRNAVRGSSNNAYTEFDPEAVEEKLGIKPEQVVDYKALCGDKSDNIPGVRGIGEKTAVKLLTEYTSLENVYQNLEQIKGAVKKKLEAGEKNAQQSQYLAQLIFDIPLGVSIESCQLQGFDTQVITSLLEKLELKKFLKQVNDLQQRFGGKVEILNQENTTKKSKAVTEFSSNKQLSLFNLDIPEEEAKRELVTKITPTNNNEMATSPIKPQIIDTSDKLTTLIKQLKTYTNPNQAVAWDTETTSLDPRDAELVGIGCCWGERETDIAYIPISHNQGNQLDKEKILTALRPILESKKYPKSLQNAKFDRVVLWHQGINLKGVIFDTMLASYVLHPEINHNLTDLSEQYLSGITSKSYKELGIPKGKTIADLDIITVADYCGLDAYATFCLVSKLQAELDELPILNKLLLEVEQPLELVLATIENQGISIDITYLQQLSQQLETDLNKLEKQAYQDAGEKFNLGSPKQLSVILFEQLNLNRKKSRKTKTGYSTDHATLEKLRGDHPVIDHILEYRTLSKLKSTYVDALPELVHPKSQRIHTNFNQTVTATGRLSSSNPNLQNIPIRTEFSRQIRKAFIPTNNWLLASADYSQIELRILAHLSQEKVLVEAYRHGEDVHSVTAKLLLEKETITTEERRLGKIINFGVIYGMGAQRFARESGISSEIGKDFIERYRQRYANIFSYLERVKKEAIAQGFVTTILGRRRYFNFVSNSLRKLRGYDPKDIDLNQLKFSYSDSQLLRAAANSPIQGSSADIIKIAMIKIHQILQNYQAQLLLQVHDELVFEIPPNEWEELQIKIKSTMENALKLTIPLVVDVHSGKNWMEAK